MQRNVLNRIRETKAAAMTEDELTEFLTYLDLLESEEHQILQQMNLLTTVS